MKMMTMPKRQMRGSERPSVALPELPAFRPVRRGGFWPGENFTMCNRRLALAEVLAEPADRRPELTGKPGSRL
jgi:hypothetical protein